VSPVRNPAVEPAARSKPTPEARQEIPRKPRRSPDTVRVSSAKLDALAPASRELLAAKLAAHQRAAGLRQLQSVLTNGKRKWAKLRGDSENPSTNTFAPGEWQRWWVAKWPAAANHDFSSGTANSSNLLRSKLADLAKATAQDQRSVGTQGGQSSR